MAAFMEEATIEIPEVNIAPPWKAMGIAFLPISYLIGFLAWSIHSEVEGLGFLSLSAAQYLAGGLSMTIIFFISWVGFVGIHAWIRSMEGKRIWKFIGLILIESLLIIVSIFIFFSISIYIVNIEANEWFPFIFALIASLTFIFLRLIITFMIGLVDFGINRIFPDATEDTNPKDIRNFRFHVNINLFTQMRRTAPALLALLIALILAHGHLSLPLTPSEYGGAQPRIGVFLLDPDGLTPASQERLLQPSQDPHNETVATATLSVFVATDHSYLVRLVHPPEGEDYLYEISRDIVHAVIWLA